MAYYTGNVNNYDDLLGAIVTACQALGWTWADSILSKGSAFVKLTVSTVSQETAGSVGSGILMQGGTGQTGATLINPTSCQPRLGRPCPNADYFAAVTWPATYHIHIFNNPDEVFVVLNFDTQYHYWLAFGVSDVSGLPGTGQWIAAVSPMQAYSTSWGDGISITPTTGQTAGSSSGTVCTGFFWADYRGNNANQLADTIHSNFDGLGWQGYARQGSANSFNAVAAATPHIGMTPSAWNQDAPLIPIHGYVWRSEYKCSLAVQIRGARYIRVDNYEPGDIITLGTDKWKVYPFYLKNASVRDGGSRINHTGTFGWALRYDA